MSISRIALKVSADASLRVTKVPKFEPDPREIGYAFHRAGAEIGHVSADFERGRFEIGSYVYHEIFYLPCFPFSNRGNPFI